MENKYIFFLVLYSFGFLQCSTMKTEKQGDLAVTELSQAKPDMSYRSNPDSIHTFNCKGKKYELRARNISRPYFPYTLRDCLLDRGFHGDEEANKQLATIIRNTRYNDLLIFGGIDVDYRGSTIFEAFLEKSQDYTPIYLNTFDYGEDSIYTCIVSEVYIRYYGKMIKSIDGSEPFHYISKYMNPQELDNFLYGEDDLFNPAYGIEVGTKVYNAISKAWKEGKIVLKEYGEK